MIRDNSGEQERPPQAHSILVTGLDQTGRTRRTCEHRCGGRTSRRNHRGPGQQLSIGCKLSVSAQKQSVGRLVEAELRQWTEEL